MSGLTFTCPLCGAISHNPNDVRERYCGRCHVFVDDVPQQELPECHRHRGKRCPGECQYILAAGECILDSRSRAAERARAAYSGPSFPERLCDHCGKPYRGPAVYCSLDCALADA